MRRSEAEVKADAVEVSITRDDELSRRENGPAACVDVVMAYEPAEEEEESFSWRAER